MFGKQDVGLWGFKNGGQRVCRVWTPCTLDREDPAVTGTHCGLGALSPAGSELGWLLLQAATRFSVNSVLLTHHLEAHAAEGLVASGLGSFQKLSPVPHVASGFSAS